MVFFSSLFGVQELEKAVVSSVGQEPLLRESLLSADSDKKPLEKNALKERKEENRALNSGLDEKARGTNGEVLRFANPSTPTF